MGRQSPMERRLARLSRSAMVSESGLATSSGSGLAGQVTHVSPSLTHQPASALIYDPLAGDPAEPACQPGSQGIFQGGESRVIPIPAPMMPYAHQFTVYYSILEQLSITFNLLAILAAFTLARERADPSRPGPSRIDGWQEDVALVCEYVEDYVGCKPLVGWTPERHVKHVRYLVICMARVLSLRSIHEATLSPPTRERLNRALQVLVEAMNDSTGALMCLPPVLA